jgi:hypothetical protein
VNKYLVTARWFVLLGALFCIFSPSGFVNDAFFGAVVMVGIFVGWWSFFDAKKRIMDQRKADHAIQYSSQQGGVRNNDSRKDIGSSGS